MNIADYQRIMIIGNNGSGKSHMARELAEITGLPLTHLDREFWRPNWEMPTREEWAERNRQLIAGERWIIDGMIRHGDTMALRYAAAELVMILDINRFVCCYGVIKRAGKLREDMPPYLWNSRGPRFLRLCKRTLLFNTKAAYASMREAYPETPVLVINSRREMNRLLKQWSTQF